MSLKYVSKEIGNDSNNGDSVSTPYATLQKGVDNVSAGDSIILDPSTKGYEIYSEAISMAAANSGTAGNFITIYGDVEGTYFGNRGYVGLCSKIVYDSLDIAAGSDYVTAHLITGSGKDYWKLENIIVEPVYNSASVLGMDGGAGCAFWYFKNCDINYRSVACVFTRFGDATFEKCSVIMRLPTTTPIEMIECFIYCDSTISNIVATLRNCFAIGNSGGVFGTGSVSYNCNGINCYDGICATNTPNHQFYDRQIPSPITLFTSMLVDKSIGAAFPFKTLPYCYLAQVGLLANSQTEDIFGNRFNNSINGGYSCGIASSSIAVLDENAEMSSENSLKMPFSGNKTFKIYVNANKRVTVSASVKFNSAYDADNDGLPQLILRAGLGSVLKSDAHSGGADTVDTLIVQSDVTVTKGEMTIDIQTFGSVPGSLTWIDNIEVSET